MVCTNGYIQNQKLIYIVWGNVIYSWAWYYFLHDSQILLNIKVIHSHYEYTTPAQNNFPI